jgi:hypothetical protein
MKKIQMCKRNVGLAVLGFSAILFTISCSKSNSNPNTGGGGTPPTTGNSFVSVTNASPTTSMYGVYSDNTNIYPAGTIGYGSSTGITNGSPYETISDSSHSIYLSNNGTRTNIDSSFAFQDSGYYSLFVYDTGQVRTLALRDNFSTPPPSGDADVRFLNFSSNSPALTIQLIGQGTINIDSVSYTNIAYSGTTTTTADSLAVFKSVTAGTYRVLLNSGISNLFTNDSVTFTAGKFYTLYIKGYVNGIHGTDSLGLGVTQNY